MVWVLLLRVIGIVKWAAGNNKSRSKSSKGMEQKEE